MDEPAVVVVGGTSGLGGETWRDSTSNEAAAW